MIHFNVTVDYLYFRLQPPSLFPKGDNFRMHTYKCMLLFAKNYNCEHIESTTFRATEEQFLIIKLALGDDIFLTYDVTSE
jgi:hypothetical protein